MSLYNPPVGHIRYLDREGAVPDGNDLVAPTDNMQKIYNMLSSGGLWSGGGLTYGVSGSMDITPPRSKGLDLDAAEFVQLNPQPTTNTLHIINSQNIKFRKVHVRKHKDNVDATGITGVSHAILFENSSGIICEHVEAEGDGAGQLLSFVKSSDIMNLYPHMHDAAWQASTDPNVEQILGSIYTSCSNVYILFPRYYNLTTKMGDWPNAVSTALDVKSISSGPGSTVKIEWATKAHPCIAWVPVTGQSVRITATGQAALDGNTFVLTVVDATHFSLNGTTFTVPAGAGGTATGQSIAAKWPPAGSWQPFETDGSDCSGCANVTMVGGSFQNMAEGMDITGSDPANNSGIQVIGVRYLSCGAYGGKFVHGMVRSGAYNCIAEDCGLAGFVLTAGAPFALTITSISSGTAGAVRMAYTGQVPATGQYVTISGTGQPALDGNTYNLFVPTGITTYFELPYAPYTSSTNTAGIATVKPVVGSDFNLDNCRSVNTGSTQFAEVATVGGVELNGLPVQKDTFVGNFRATADVQDMQYRPSMVVRPQMFCTHMGRSYQAAMNEWQGGAAQLANSVVSYRNAYYVCNQDHTSSLAAPAGRDFRGDRRAGLWKYEVTTPQNAMTMGAPVHTSGTVLDGAGIPWAYMGADTVAKRMYFEAILGTIENPGDLQVWNLRGRGETSAQYSGATNNLNPIEPPFTTPALATYFNIGKGFNQPSTWDKNLIIPGTISEDRSTVSIPAGTITSADIVLPDCVTISLTQSGAPGAVTIHGIPAPAVPGQRRRILNSISTTQTVTFASDSGTEPNAANRLRCPGLAPLVFAAGHLSLIDLYYSGAHTKWLVENYITY